MNEYAISFGIEYDQPGDHPAHPRITKKTYVVIDAETMTEAREVAAATFGDHWSTCYSVADSRFQDIAKKYNWLGLRLGNE